MKVLVVVARDGRHPRAAGGDRHLDYMAHLLADAGYEVTLFSASDPSLPRKEMIDGVTVERLAPPRLFAPAVWAALAGTFHRKFDLVIEEIIGGERTPFLVGLFGGTPRVGFWYQDNRPLFRDHYGAPLRWTAGVIQHLLLRSYRDGWLLTPSLGSRRWLIDQGFPPERVGIVYPHVDENRRFDPLPTFEQRRNRFVVIGNFRPLKRFEEAIEVVRRLRDRVPDVELVLLGRRDDDRYLAELRHLARQQGVEDRVVFAVGVSDEEKFRVLREAKALSVHSSIEGFALTLCEAGICGVPAVVNPGTPDDAFEDGVSGLRRPIGDVAGYSEAIARLMTDRGLWDSLSAGAKQVAHRFTRSDLDPAVVALLQQAARRSGRK